MEKKSTDKEIKIGTEEQDVSKKEVSKIEDIWGSFRVTSIVPTGKPTKFGEQIVIYTNSTDYRLYWYDYQANVWHYVTATA